MRRIAISLGDVTGIGPEVTLKALAELPEDGTQFLLLGDGQVIKRTANLIDTNYPIEPLTSANNSSRVVWHNPGPDIPEGLQPGSPLAAEAALAALRDGGLRCLRGECQALVTAPVSKESIIRLGNPFTGQTEYLSDLAGTSRTAMMLLGPDDRGRWLRVALATTHLPLRMVSENLTQEKIEMVVELAAESCKLLKLPRCRVAVCGLNPHAGEGGEIGDEEIKVIRPAVEALKRRGLDVVGPISADTLFYYALRGDYDAVVAMYHDQGLCPLKMSAFENGVNWTLGLPFIRTSPDHGTAYDIASKGVANPSSMKAAIELARQLAT